MSVTNSEGKIKNYVDERLEAIAKKSSELERRVESLANQKCANEIAQLQKGSPAKESSCDIERIVNEWTKNFELQIAVT